MQVQLRHALISLAIVAMAFLSHGRVLSSGWLGHDLRLLERVRAAPEPTRAGELWLDAGDERRDVVEGRASTAHVGDAAASGDVRPILKAALVAHVRGAEAGDDGAPRPFGGRLGALVVLLASAAAAGFALRRALFPWIGGDTARAAGFALALFFATHPLGTAAIARPRAWGDLSALLFGSLACWAFLRGRQQREKLATAASAACAILAGFSSSIAIVLPFVLFGLELGSTRRVRSLPERLRTATTTWVVFGACVLFESVCATLAHAPGRDGFERAFPAVASGVDAWPAVARVVEKIGILFLPVPGRPGSSSWPHYLVSVALVLVAAVPVLRSARSAPRLWGWLALAWGVAMVAALIPLAGARVEPGDYSRADGLVTAGMFACTGLAVAATAQLGTRRILLPAVIALGFAWLGNRACGSFARAGAAVEDLRASVAAAGRACGEGVPVIVLDPEERAGGLDLGLFDDGVLRRDARAVAIALPGPALSTLSRTSLFAEWRAAGVVVLERATEPGSDSGWRERRIQASSGDAPPVEWRADVRSPWFERDLDPARTRFAVVVPQPGASTADAPTLSWRTGESRGESAEKPPTTTGVWLEGENSPIAVFDLAGEPAWWSAAGVRRVSTGVGLSQVDTARLVADLPLDLVEAEPAVVGDDWRFEVRVASLPRPLHGDARFDLELLVVDPSVTAAAFARFPCDVEDVATPGGTVRVTARGVAAFERERARRSLATSAAWSLERRVGSVVVARSSGRR